MNKTSSLYQELSQAELENIIAENFNAKLKSAKLLSGGMFNTTYLVEYGMPVRKAVLRLGPVNRHLLLPFEENLMEAEAYVYELCKQRSIPTSKVLACDTTKELLDRDYMIVEYIDSIPLCDERISQDAKKSLYEKTGEYAAMFHAITHQTFGRVSGLVQGKGYDKWSEFFLAEATEWVQKSREYNVFPEKVLQAVLQVYENNRDLLDTVTTPHLIHADIWEGNVLVQQNGKEYEFAALIDADRAIFGDIDFEFATPWMTNEDFCKGYCRISDYPIVTEKTKKKKLYFLLCCFEDTYILKTEYNNLEGFESSYENLLALLKELA